jgi:hypothetical protein
MLWVWKEMWVKSLRDESLPKNIFFGFSFCLGFLDNGPGVFSFWAPARALGKNSTWVDRGSKAFSDRILEALFRARQNTKTKAKRFF